MYEFIEADLSAKFREEHNLNSINAYHLTLDGNIILPDECFVKCRETALNDSNERYVLLARFREGEYSDDIVKRCKLKHKGNFNSFECVFDKQTNKIVCEVPDLKWDRHINLYKNIAELDGVFTHLPTGKVLFSAKYGVFKLWKTKNFLFVREGYGSPVVMIATDTGEVETYE